MGFPEDGDEFADVHASILAEGEQLDAMASAKLDAAMIATDEEPTSQVPKDNAASEKYDESADAAMAAALSYEEVTCGLVEDPPFFVCQICMDVLLADDAVTQLCGKTCLAEICAECLVQHLTASVYSFYPGVLPKVRCPICLNLMNKNVWKKFVKPGQAETSSASTTTAVDAADNDDAELNGSRALEGVAVAEVEPEGDNVDTVEQPRLAENANADGADGGEAVAEPDADDNNVEQSPAETSPSAENTDNNDAAEGEREDEGNAVGEAEAEQPPTEAPVPAAVANDDAWRLDHSHVLDKYEILCRQSCEFQSPCCHNPEYTMLPKYQEQNSTLMTLPRSQAEQVATLRKRCRAFCYHREETKSFYEFIFETFDENAEALFWKVLTMIIDEERRATLLLYHLFLHPDTRTLCCDEIVCFKCKASVHHDGQCNDFIEDDCVLQCRGCHVTLVKVDGCDSVSCVCGQSIHWPSEMEKQRAQRKQLAPEDDVQYSQWQQWMRKLDRTFRKIQSLDATLREIRLNRLIREKRVVLREMLVHYKSRKQELLALKQLKELEREDEAKQSLAELETAVQSPEETREVQLPKDEPTEESAIAVAA